MNRTIPDYLRIATLHRVIDGDTVELMVDLGFRRYSRERIRLLGIDAPEIRGPARLQGLAAMQFASHWFAEAEIAGDRILLVSHRADSFGRWLGSIYRLGPDGELGESLADALMATGHATLYPAA